MTNSRRSNVQSSEKGSSASPQKIQKEDKSPNRKRKPRDPTPEPVVEVSTSRPKRNTRKSVLLASGDFEVSYPGTKVEEPDSEEPETAQPNVVTAVAVATASTSQPKPKRTRSETAAEKSDIEVDVEGEVEETDFKNNTLEMTGPEVDVEVEVMSNIDENNEDMMITLKEPYSDGEYNEDDDIPPRLEKVKGVPEAKRKRGRPRKYPIGQTPFRRTASLARPRQSLGRPPGFPRNKYTYDKPITKTEAEKINSFNVKLFEDEIGVTEHGDVYATVIPGCLSYLLRKERIIDLLTNRNEINSIRQQGWMSRKSPRLPPLVTTKACFAFYVEGAAVTSIRDLSSDDLKPWTSSVSDPCEGEPVIKPNVRKHAIMRQGARLVPSKGDPRTADIHLTEYSAWLPRCLRLRKKIFYLARNGHIIGNVLILYDFTTSGDIPVLLNIVHGNEAFRTQTNDEEFEKGHLLFVGDNEDPFMEEIMPGPRGERFLQVKPDKYGWTNNKKLLLKYLINEPSLLDQSGFLNQRIPYLPPLIETRGVFVYFAPSSMVADQIHFTGDGLSPWTFQGASVNHRVRTVKRALCQNSQGVFETTKEDWQTTGLALVETITILCRCPRLRKRILYVQRQNSVVIGIVCFIYEYMREGPIPEIIKTNPKAGSMLNNENMGPLSLHHRDHGDFSRRKQDTTSNTDEMVDVEELVEEEVVQDDMHEQENAIERLDRRSLEYSRMEEYEELPEDSLDGGWDTEFDEDLLATQENPMPFFDGIRQLESGHTYLTVRHKRIASNMETILEYIANSNFVDEKGLMNTSKPTHPPLVRNARAYVFFVAANAVFPHDINRDDFSPWSANATPENPTCYRSKVRKVGVLCDPKTGHFTLQDGDYKLYPYHLVALYSIHPKEARLRKRITYLMDTDTKMIVSHVMIMYDFNTEGPIPHISGPYGKRSVRRRGMRRIGHDPSIDDVLDDVSETSESEKESPFSAGVQATPENAFYLPLANVEEFWTDRNRILNYLVNKPHLLDSLVCLNNRVPMFPPLIAERGAFAFFMDGSEVDVRNLTCDGLGPWSENLHLSNGSIMCRRPKSCRVPLGLNRDGHLRIIKGKRPSDVSEFTMHIYAATLPRLTRLKKKVYYLSKDGVQFGHSLIIYNYDQEGELPQAVAHGNSVHADNVYIRLPPSLKEDARKMLHTLSPQETAKQLSDRHGIPVNARSIYNVKREMNRTVMPMNQRGDMRYEVKVEGSYDELEDSMADYVPDWLADRRHDNEQIVAVPPMDLHQTVEVGTVRRATRQVRKNGISNTGAAPRAHQTEQIFRYVSNMLSTRNDNETFDAIWRTLVQKNETRILQNIKKDFGVEIVAERNSRNGDTIEVRVTNAVMDESVMQEQILEGEIVEEEVINEEDLLGEVVLDTTLEDPHQAVHQMTSHDIDAHTHNMEAHASTQMDVHCVNQMQEHGGHEMQDLQAPPVLLPETSVIPSVKEEDAESGLIKTNAQETQEVIVPMPREMEM